MEKRFERVDQRLDHLDQKIDHLTEIAIKNTAILEEHQRRSLALENHVELLEKAMEPLQTHIKLVNLIFKLMAAGAAMAVAIKNLLL